MSITSNKPVMSDDEFDQFLLNELKKEKFSLLDLHGQTVMDWYNRKDAGPLLLFVAVNLLDPDFAEELNHFLEDCYMFCYQIAGDIAENDYFVITLSHKEYDRVLVFGQEFTTDEFDRQMEIAISMMNQEE